MPDDYDGSDLADSAGEHIGTVERTYVDDGGNARFIQVKLGHLFGKHRLVPADQVEQQGDGLQVPYTRDSIEESPHVDPNDTLEGADLDAVRAYYESDLAGTAGADGGDSTEMPTGATDSNSNGSFDAPMETVETIETEPAPGNLGVVRDLGDVVEVPIVEEVLVKKQVVREVLRVKKSHLVEQGVAAADLRREDVEVVPSGEGLIREDQTGDATDNAS